MTLSLTVLGSSGSFAGPANPCSGYFVADGDATLWLDCGPGTLGPLQEHVDLADLDAVMVTHSHPDHSLEIPVLRNALRYLIHREGLAVYGPADALERMEAALGATVAPTLDWRVVTDGSSFSVGGLAVRCSRTDHPVETMAVRIEDADGTAVAYSSDTGPEWSFDRFGAPVDLAVCEASLPPEEEGTFQHLSGRQAGERGREVGASRLVITHLPPGTDADRRRREAGAAFGAPVEVAVPGARYEL